MSLHLHVPDAVNLDVLMSERGERSMGKTLVKITTETGSVVVRTLLLTNRTLYEFSVDPSLAAQIIGIAQPGIADPRRPSLSASEGLSLPPLISVHSLKEKPLTDLHSIAPAAGDAHSFHLHFFSGSLSHRAAHSLTKLKRLLTLPTSSFSSFLKSKLLTFSSPSHARIFYVLLQALMAADFQRMTEAAVLASPEYYQRHAFVMKGAKDRLLLLSNAFLYNVETSYHPTVVRSVKWCISIQAVSHVGLAVSASGEHKEDAAEGGGEESAMLVIGFDIAKAQRLFDSGHRGKRGGGDLGSKDSWQFVFRSEEERRRFVQSMQKVFHENTGQHLKPHQVHLP